ncbi:hypothetical protein [Phyllobacterium zundukense]|uniref:Uncharacterized protein n=1 Tax=Phyllobacterium zundukense TaxID=1867719 RepID=A0ACD4D4P1_9HYPH|nr:hypothetical protein [Phyllobacterium zundukense]UXN60766.1 hypothetical protein N8E88_30565 [Phyllobacterium zundukense]
MSQEMLLRISAKQRILAAKMRLHTHQPDAAMLALIKAEIRMNEDFLDIVDSYFLGRKANFHPDQPRVSAGNPDGGQWTGESGGSSGLVQPVYMRREDPLSSPMALGGGGSGGIAGGGMGSGILLAPHRLREGGRSTGLLPAEDAIAEYNRLSNQRDPSLKPVLLCRPKDWDKDDQLQPGTKAKATVELLTKNEVKKYCPEIGIVQSLANEAVNLAEPRSNYETPWLFGTAAHTNLKNLANAKYPSILRTERSYLKFAEEVAAEESIDNFGKYALKNTIRIDLLGPETNSRVCIYDFKTGKAGISVPRAQELRNTAHKHYPHIEDIVVVEVNPDER